MEDDEESDTTDPRSRHPLSPEFLQNLEKKHNYEYNPIWSEQPQSKHASNPGKSSSGRSIRPRRKIRNLPEANHNSHSTVTNASRERAI